jgi:hypothetical protein
MKILWYKFLQKINLKNKQDLPLPLKTEFTYGAFYKASNETPFEFISFSIGKNNSVIVNLKNVKSGKVYKIPKEMFDTIFVRITK